MRYRDLPEAEERPALDESELRTDPITMLGDWIDHAVATAQPISNGVALATVSGAGVPSVRMVLLKELDEAGLVFFSHYDSRKGREIDANPNVALLLWWASLHRQVRVVGSASRLSAAESDAYFATRPRESCLSTIASPQSQPVANRAELEQAVEAARSAAGDRPLERPASWGGYRVEPAEFEFFQGRANRLHDRFRYLRDGDTWRVDRLAP